MLAMRNPVLGEFIPCIVAGAFRFVSKKYDCSGELLNSGTPLECALKHVSYRRGDQLSLRDRAAIPAQRCGLYQDAKDREANKHDGRS